MISFGQEPTRDPAGQIVGYHWIGLLICEHCRATVRKSGPTLATPDALPTMRQLLMLRQLARESGWVMASTTFPGDFCRRCALQQKPASNDADAPGPVLRPVCQNCGALVPRGRLKFCADACQAEARGDRVILARQNERGRPRRCHDCGASFTCESKRGPIPIFCPACRFRRKKH